MPKASPPEKGCLKPARVGCLGLVVVLAVLMLASFFLFNRGVGWTLHRARAHLERALPKDLPAAKRDRLERDLDRFFRASSGSATTPRMGAFLVRVGDVLEDGQVTPAEVDQVIEFLEREAPDHG